MKQNIRILLHGFINMNVMDGSAVFLNGVAKMLSLNSNITIDLLLATPIQRDILLKELYPFDNINIISPFDDEKITSSNPTWFKRGRLEHQDAAFIISHYWEQNNYDWLLIRGMEVVDKLYDVNPDIFKKIMTYVTGITNNTQKFANNERITIDKIFKSSEYLLCQTEEMKQFLLTQFANSTSKDKVITLNPMIPDTTDQFDVVFEKKHVYQRLAYVGKFHYDWNSIPMIIGFKEVRQKYPLATFSIAGDKFTNHKNHPNYNKDLKYLLTNTANLVWYGALSRNEARRLIMNCDIGITWRSENMNDSLELSTKLLEYGSLGKAVVMNRTPMHESIFGTDYPVYANSLDEFETAICSLIESPKIYYEASKRMFEASQNFTYSKTLNKLMPFLFKYHNIDSVLKQRGFQHKYDNTYTHLEQTETEFFLLQADINRFDSLFNFYMKASKLGEVTFSTVIGNEIFIIVKETNNSFEENLKNNINNEQFEEILSTALQTNVMKLNSTKEVIQLKSASKLQQPLNDNSFPLEKQLKELKIIENKYNNLANSMLGRLTLWYWNFRKRKLHKN